MGVTDKWRNGQTNALVDETVGQVLYNRKLLSLRGRDCVVRSPPYPREGISDVSAGGSIIRVLTIDKTLEYIEYEEIFLCIPSFPTLIRFSPCMTPLACILP